uniref:Uncharacterized protein n=1 Tax=Arundo donax TaxID=35708 RepID=A0A0A9B5A0_ARUDO
MYQLYPSITSKSEY